VLYAAYFGAENPDIRQLKRQIFTPTRTGKREENGKFFLYSSSNNKAKVFLYQLCEELGPCSVNWLPLSPF